MSIHWEHNYNIPLDNVNHHKVVIYNYSEEYLVLHCPELFNKGFGKYFEEIEGIWEGDIYLKTPSGEKKISGWYFSKSSENQERLFSLLKRIHDQDVPPIQSEFRHVTSEKEMEFLCKDIYFRLEQVFDIIPEEKDSFTLPIPGGETIFYFNKTDTDRTRGECIMKTSKNKKKVDIYQYIYV